MRQWRWFLIICGLTGSVWAAGIPAKITYQGTLKDKGVPASGTYTLTFRIKDASGLTQYWDSGPMSVPITQGLFSVTLQPIGVDWQNVSPYIEVAVGNPPQTLAPSEAINASVYAYISNSVVDGAITPEKVVSGYGLVPSGAIMMFNAACPTGWIRFTALDNRFPLGVDPSLMAPSTQGGSASHSHSISTDGAHNHGGLTSAELNDRTDGKLGGPDFVPAAGHKHTISTDGAHNHGGATGPTTWLPPYTAIVFCQKQ